MLTHLKVLEKLYVRLKDRDIDWVVTGSLGLWLRGLDTEVNDIDIQTDRLGAYQIERIFSEFTLKPVAFSSAEKIQSHLGALKIDGIKVEIMGDIQKRDAEGRWDSPVDLREYREYVEIEGMQIPVLSLAYEYEAYLRLGRVEKAEMLRKWLNLC